MSEFSVVTDQRYAPVFQQFLAEHLGIHFDAEHTRFIASCVGTDVVGVTALNNWTEGHCEAHAATDGSKRSKFDRKYIWTVFDYAFNHAGKNCMVTFVSTENLKSLALQELLGFARIGLVEGYYGEGKDAVAFSMTKQQWLDGKWGSFEATEEEN